MKLYHGLLLGIASGVVGSRLSSNSIRAEIDEALGSPPGYRVQGRLVSVVVPALHEEDYLPLLLQSITHQTYTPVEIIVADSSEGIHKSKTEDICRDLGAIYVRAPARNISASRNEGARNAKADILLFADADCIMTKEYIEKLTDQLENGYILAHGSDPFYDGGWTSMVSMVNHKWFKPVSGTTSSVAMWAKDFWGIGGYSETCNPLGELPCREDTDLGRRVKNRFGTGNMIRVSDAIIATSARRASRVGFTWPWGEAGYRNGVVH